MMLRSFMFVFLMFIGFNNLFSQEMVFVDENLEPVDIELYYKKCNSFLFQCYKFQQDTVSVNAIRQYYKFGKLDSIENIQIRQLLSRDIKRKLDDNKTIIINFKDTIYGYDHLNNISRQKEIYVENDSASVKSYRRFIRLSESEYNSYRRTFDKDQKKCLKKFSDYNIEPIYFYRYNIYYNITNKTVEWNKMSTSIHTIFFKNSHSKNVILKPNGDYFIYRYLPEKHVENLLAEVWDPYILDYNNALKSLNADSFGFFQDIISTPSQILETHRNSYSGSSSIPSSFSRNKGGTYRYINKASGCFSSPRF